MDYIIKQIPEDFVVEEIPKLELVDDGRFLIFRLKKKDRGSEDVAGDICRLFNMKRKFIGYAGNKDKKAVTTQYLSIRITGNPAKITEKLSAIRNCKFEYVGQSINPISIGDLESNRFGITVRGLDKAPDASKSPIPNYFDEQRFSKVNVEVGRSIIKRDFKKAAKLVLDAADSSSTSDMLAKIEANDHIGALRCVPKKTLTLFIHAYQSFLFNELVSVYLNWFKCVTVKYSQGIFRFPRQEVANIEVPIIGFGMDEVKEEKLKPIIDKILKQENLTPRDFIIPQIPELSFEGRMRDLLMNISEMKQSSLEADDLNVGKHKIKVSFVLGPGSYATIVVKSLFS
ncbi:MAG: tRNA pseudouridine(13) synthase TruD [Nanoarchaeota archaeon]|nr:tRNA pseudouridine(13) synthase TruD [Nanoarchaeota archaeon]